VLNPDSGRSGAFMAQSAAGPRVLIVEDQLSLGMHLAAILEDCGYEPVGPACTVITALPLAIGEPLDAALLDIYLIDQKVEPVASVLQRRGIPFGFVTAYSRDHLPPAFQTRPYVNKPFTDQEVRTLLSLLTGPASTIAAAPAPLR
jgi:CheY-like chemotaxis protein